MELTPNQESKLKRFMATILDDIKGKSSEETIGELLNTIAALRLMMIDEEHDELFEDRYAQLQRELH